MIGVLVPEDLTADPQQPAVTCEVCGGALGGLRLVAGHFVHRLPESCRTLRRRPRPGVSADPLTNPLGEQ